MKAGIAKCDPIRARCPKQAVDVWGVWLLRYGDGLVLVSMAGQSRPKQAIVISDKINTQNIKKQNNNTVPPLILNQSRHGPAITFPNEFTAKFGETYTSVCADVVISKSNCGTIVKWEVYCDELGDIARLGFIKAPFEDNFAEPNCDAEV